jgi:diguanylate cyclase (GGDEF)-like protein
MSLPSDLFDAETRALETARAVFDDPAADGERCRQALGELAAAYERLLRETRRLIRRSDRSELEMNQLNQRLQALADQLEFRATHDSLTGVLNRAAIIDRANRFLTAGGLALIVLDIDHFKRVNDSFGHPVGDQVICGVVDCLKGLVPASAHIGRVGGEEFTVLLPSHSLDGAAQLAELMRQAIAAHAFDLPDHSGITASFGVSWLSSGSGFDEAYGLADEALYAAKRNGRNRVTRADSVEDAVS